MAGVTKAKIESLRKNFAQDEIGGSIRFLEVIDSTNRLALELPAAQARHGLVVVAREQTAGRGRAGRPWLSLPDVGLHFTAVLLPKKTVSGIQLVNFAGALAVHDALRKFCESHLDIRWPNDVLLGGRKVSGILAEAAFKGQCLERLVLGVSVNVGHKLHDFAVMQPMPTAPTSILLSEGFTPAMEEVLLAVLQGLNCWYDVLISGGAGAILSEIRRRSSYVSGRRLVIEVDEQQLDVTSVCLNEDGSLQVRMPSGCELRLLAGDVRVLE
jgi:BirA family biotin operon repressor/biotin-[acetyl-CoA-carboxylase] ligase